MIFILVDHHRYDHLPLFFHRFHFLSSPLNIQFSKSLPCRLLQLVVPQNTRGLCRWEEIIYVRCPNFGTMEGSIVLTRLPLELMEWQWVSMVANNRPKVQTVLNPCSGLLYRVALSHIILSLQKHEEMDLVTTRSCLKVNPTPLSGPGRNRYSY